MELLSQIDTMSRTETTSPPLKATVPLAVWACATQDSNPRPQWFGIRDTWFSNLRHSEDASYKAAEQRFQCKNEHTKAG